MFRLHSLWPAIDPAAPDGAPAHSRGRFSGLLLGLAAAATIAFFIPRAFSRWDWFYDENGALYGYIGSNYLRNGLRYTRAGAQHWTSFDGPRRAPVFYSTHPPILGWLCGLAQWLLGVWPFAVRLVPALAQLASLIPLFLVGKRLFGRRVAAWGTLLYAVLPMTAYFGFQVCYESLTNLFNLIAVYFYVRLHDEGWSPGRVLGLVLALVAGMWTDWPAYFCALGIGLDWFVTERGWQRLRCAVPWAAGLVSFALFLAFIYQLGGTGTGGMGSLFSALANRTGTSPDEEYTLGEYGSFVGMQFLRLYGVGLLLLLGGLAALRTGRTARPVLVLLAVAVLNITVFSFGAFTHEFWLFYFVSPTALGAMAIAARWADMQARFSVFVSRLSARVLRLPSIVAIEWTAITLLAAQSIWVIQDYNSPGYARWLGYHIRFGEVIAERARPDEVIMMSFSWGEGAATGYYAQRPVVRVHSIEELVRVRSHPDFRGGYLIQSSEFDATGGEKLLESFESIAELEVYGSWVKILYVPPATSIAVANWTGSVQFANWPGISPLTHLAKASRFFNL